MSNGATIEQMARVIALYESTLSIVASYPVPNTFHSNYIRGKCIEALLKKNEAIDGIIYGQIEPTDAMRIPDLKGLR